MKRRNRHSGFTMVEIMIVFGIIGMLVALAVPGWLKAREKTRSNVCQENLQKIDQSKELWALNTKAPTGASIAWSDLVEGSRQGYIQRTPECPTGGVYTLDVVGSVPTCSVGATVGFGAPPHILQ